ncbi:MAG: hypothetical protein IIY58_03880, partial [Aeriscardovia sp.]|nr:hypothetical protein [Aeriscardovia sp.]
DKVKIKRLFIPYKQSVGAGSGKWKMAERYRKAGKPKKHNQRHLPPVGSLTEKRKRFRRLAAQIPTMEGRRVNKPLGSCKEGGTDSRRKGRKGARAEKIGCPGAAPKGQLSLKLLKISGV